jgi:pimeloyl-ACP methyl ester carboxylesterase
LPQVKAPALVLHCRNDAVHPFDEGRRLAAGIPGARFVALEGSNHVILESDPAWPRFIEEISTFLPS